MGHLQPRPCVPGSTSENRVNRRGEARIGLLGRESVQGAWPPRSQVGGGLSQHCTLSGFEPASASLTGLVPVSLSP